MRREKKRLIESGIYSFIFYGTNKKAKSNPNEIRDDLLISVSVILVKDQMCV
jgi:hypothetical protein